MDWYNLGRRHALEKLGLSNSSPMLRGEKVDVDGPEKGPAKPPVPRVMPPPPHATSGTLLNPKVA